MRNQSLLREFIQYLQEHPSQHKVTALAQHFGVSRKTIYKYRDDALTLYGVIIDDASSNPSVQRGCLRIADGSPPLHTIVLSREEIDALATAVQRLEPLTPLGQQALEKLVEAKHVSPAPPEPVLYTPLSDQYPPELFERVARAIREQRVALVTYRNARGEEKTYRFNPYVLVPSEAHLHLLGVSHASLQAGFDTVVPLRLDQVESFTLTTERFRTPNFDPAEYCRTRFKSFMGDGEPVSVRVRFSPEKAQFIRRTKRHPTQRVQDEPEGSVVWEVKLALSEDLTHWLTSYGPHAQVLEPLVLREQVAAWATGSLDANNSEPA